MKNFILILLLIVLLVSLGESASAQSFKKHKRQNYMKVHKKNPWWEVEKKDRVHGKITVYKQGWGWNNYLSCATVYSQQPIKRTNMKKQHYASNRQSKKR